MHFQDPRNLRDFIDNKVETLQNEYGKKLDALKKDVNAIVNNMYEEIAQKAFEMDFYRIPAHGIQHSSLENPVNLFQRQLQIEQLSFELSHEKFKKSMADLIKIGKADQLATSHRYILSWIKTLEKAISEQQAISVKRGNMDQSRIGYYLMSLPSDQIATICVVHLIRSLFTEFVHDMHSDNDVRSAVKDRPVDFTSQNFKLLTFDLCYELGNLFDKELKQRMTSKGAKKGHNEAPVEKHLLIDDQAIGAIPKPMQIKIGAHLVHLMT